MSGSLWAPRVITLLKVEHKDGIERGFISCRLLSINPRGYLERPSGFSLSEVHLQVCHEIDSKKFVGKRWDKHEYMR